MKHRSCFFVSVVSSYVPGPLQDREPEDPVSKRAMSRRRLRQSYLKFIPRFQVRICILISALRSGESAGKAASRANYKPCTNLILRRLTITTLPSPCPFHVWELSLADLIINSAFRSGYITITGPAIPDRRQSPLSFLDPPHRQKKFKAVFRGRNLFERLHFSRYRDVCWLCKGSTNRILSSQEFLHFP